MSEHKKFYRTEIRFMVLSEKPVTDEDLASLVLECNAGEDVGREISRDCQEVSISQMRDELREAGSEPDFFGLDLGTEDPARINFLEGLCSGDNVYWTDPDEGKCSCNARVVSIESSSGDVENAETVIRLESLKGSFIEALPAEISEGWRFDDPRIERIYFTSPGDHVMANGELCVVRRRWDVDSDDPLKWVFDVSLVASGDMGQRFTVFGSDIA